jgi:hypothetical protein
LHGNVSPIYDNSGLGWVMRMWLESRQFLALLGDQKVTIASFVGLLFYGAFMLIRRGTASSRSRAIFIFGGAALWLLVVMIGMIPGDLSQWSSLAVFLFVVGIDGTASSRASSVRTCKRAGRTAERATPPEPSVAMELSGDADGFGPPSFHPESIIGPRLSN